MTADLLSDLPPAARVRAKDLIAQHRAWAGELQRVSVGRQPYGVLLVTLIFANGAARFFFDEKGRKAQNE